jgi:hypothetical protein
VLVQIHPPGWRVGRKWVEAAGDVPCPRAVAFLPVDLEGARTALGQHLERPRLTGRQEQGLVVLDLLQLTRPVAVAFSCGRWPIVDLTEPMSKSKLPRFRPVDPDREGGKIMQGRRGEPKVESAILPH